MLAVIGFVSQLIVFTSAGVWVVGQIKTTTAVLSNAISNLNHTVDSLQSAVSRLGSKHDAAFERLVVVEQWCKSHDGDGG